MRSHQNFFNQPQNTAWSRDKERAIVNIRLSVHYEGIIFVILNRPNIFLMIGNHLNFYIFYWIFITGHVNNFIHSIIKNRISFYYYNIFFF